MSSGLQLAFVNHTCTLRSVKTQVCALVVRQGTHNDIISKKNLLKTSWAVDSTEESVRRVISGLYPTSDEEELVQYLMNYAGESDDEGDMNVDDNHHDSLGDEEMTDPGHDPNNSGCNYIPLNWLNCSLPGMKVDSCDICTDNDCVI